MHSKFSLSQSISTHLVTTPNKVIGLIIGLLLVAIVGRVIWLAREGNIEFESDIVALLPLSENSRLLEQIKFRVSNVVRNRITILIQGKSYAQTDEATDRFIDLADQAISANLISARIIEGMEIDDILTRIEAIADYKGGLIGERSLNRMLDAVDSQLIWRIDQVMQFPPTNLTDPVNDPLGTLEEYLLERMPNVSAVISDGPYLRVHGNTPVNLVQIELTDGEMGNDEAARSVG